MRTRGVWSAVLWASCLLLIQFCFTDAYDTMDGNGNITIKWEFTELREDGFYMVIVHMFNYQLYRHIESPGWRYGWTWPGLEVIWDMRGAEATLQGNCSKYKGGDLPHSCEKNPVIIDLLPGAPYTFQTVNCCRGGVLSSLTQNPSKSLATFRMSVGGTTNSSANELEKPYNFSLGVPGYTCSNPVTVPPTKYMVPGSQRIRQSLMTWEMTCTYTQYKESISPSCCVSLSSFYNDTVVPCPQCTCGCQEGPMAPKCLKEGEAYNNLGDGDTSIVRCTNHMCPIRVHWHVKLNYREYWRVKVTVTNFNINRNYTEWNLVIQHPNLRKLTKVFSFNYKPLIYLGANNTGVFWGINTYNDMLLQSGVNGNVQTELLFQKDPSEFTFQGGWAFPQKISFNGRECVMPDPDSYPQLPKTGSAKAPMAHILLAIFPFSVFVLLFL